MHDLVIDDLFKRKVIGLESYGTPLQVGNGRDAAQDALEEVLDLAVYLKQIKLMHDEFAKIITHLRSLHSNINEKCDVCKVVFPCHTRIDLVHMLDLLGARST